MRAELKNKLLLPDRGEKLLCAVSGGADSMCLLCMLRELGYAVAAAHFEHGIRGEESLRDERFVEKFCADKGIEYTVGRADVPGEAKKRGMGTEECARLLRYEFLERAADELHCTLIATAHNADDNAETVIFNLARGTGAAGLKGIPQRRGRLIRPLLTLSRAEIDEYLTENGIDHVEDSTNASDDYTRNIIRHRIMPVLREINSAAVSNIGSAARLIGSDDECLGEMAAEFIGKNAKDGSMDANALTSLPKAVSSRVVRSMCQKSLSDVHVEAVLSICRGSEPAYCDVPGVRIRYERGRVYFTGEQSVGSFEYALIPGKTAEITEAGVRVRAQITEYSQDVNTPFKTYQLKYENICGNLFCTSRRNGDSYRPKGRGCTKTLKSLFAEKKYSQRQRDMTLVFRDERGVAAVEGFAADERFAACPGDKVLRLDIEKIQEKDKNGE